MFKGLPHPSCRAGERNFDHSTPSFRIRPRRVTAIAVVMLTASFVILLTINLLQWWASRAAQTGV